MDVLNNHGDRKSPKDPVGESLPKWQKKLHWLKKMGVDPTTFELQPRFEENDLVQLFRRKADGTNYPH